MKIALNNLGTVNKNKVVLGNLIVWFSYETPVGFLYNGEMVVVQNCWSTTTGKLINELEPDKSKRLPLDKFDKKLNGILNNIIK